MSEFGKGCSYCLALFLCHSERKPLFDEKVEKALNYTPEQLAERDTSMWFYTATDHLYDLEIPKHFLIFENIYLWLKKKFITSWIAKKIKFYFGKSLKFKYFKKYYLWNRRLRKIHKICFENRLRMDGKTNPKLKDFVINEAKELLRLFDELHGIKTEKAQWS